MSYGFGTIGEVCSGEVSRYSSLSGSSLFDYDCGGTIVLPKVVGVFQNYVNPTLELVIKEFGEGYGQELVDNFTHGTDKYSHDLIAIAYDSSLFERRAGLILPDDVVGRVKVMEFSDLQFLDFADKESRDYAGITENIRDEEMAKHVLQESLKSDLDTFGLTRQEGVNYLLCKGRLSVIVNSEELKGFSRFDSWIRKKLGLWGKLFGEEN